MSPEDRPSPAMRPLAGTPPHGSQSLWRIALESAEIGHSTEQMLNTGLEPDLAATLQGHVPGPALAAPIKIVPKIARLLTRENIAICQIVKQSRVTGLWR